MTDEPAVESPAAGAADPDSTRHSLELRIRQQQILAQLGILALQGTALSDLLTHTVALTADGLEAEFCKVLEYLPSQKRFLVRAGVGWPSGVIGHATIGADLESPAGFALRTGRPVISNHLGREDRFRTPELLLEHGIHRAINVILQGEGSPFGVLEVDSRSAGEFAEDDLAFLQGAAGILGMAIERQRYERELKTALTRHETLLQEVDHRVKNSLQLVMSILRLQGDGTDDPEQRQELHKAAGRIAAIARVHQRLHQTSALQSIDLGAYLMDYCRDADDVAASCTISGEAVTGIEVPTERAVPLAILVNELVTNAAQHAYPGGSGGPVHVRLRLGGEGNALLTVRDEGTGLPPDFQPGTGRTLGMRLVRALTQQLRGKLSFRTMEPGAEFSFEFPLSDPAQS